MEKYIFTQKSISEFSGAKIFFEITSSLKIFFFCIIFGAKFEIQKISLQKITSEWSPGSLLRSDCFSTKYRIVHGQGLYGLPLGGQQVKQKNLKNFPLNFFPSIFFWEKTTLFKARNFSKFKFLELKNFSTFIQEF